VISPFRTGPRGAGVALALGAVLVASMALGQQPPAPSASPAQPPPSPSAPPGPGPAPSSAPAASPDSKLDTAKELFRRGVALFEAGDVEQALDHFLRSRATYPSAKNTVDAALCLDRLGRYDEALELYEDAAARFAAELDEQDRRGLNQATAALLGRVGGLQISANVAGSLVIDGRPRGVLPIALPVRVLPGRHGVRVIKDGYLSFETSVEVRAGATTHLDAHLTRLVRAGGLRIEDPASEGAEIVVDGAVVGRSPWEGTLAPGEHAVQSRTTERVSRPSRGLVVEGQTTLVRLRAEPVGCTAVLQVEPSTAALAIEDVPVGKARWEGVLPAGSFRVRATEEGYFPDERLVRIAPGQGCVQRVQLRLGVDPDHPRWPKPPSGHVFVEGFGGFAIGSSLGSGPEGSCPGSCSSAPPVMGMLVGARAGYELGARVSLEVGAGYLSLVRDVERTLHASYESGGQARAVSYVLEDVVRLKGPLVLAGVGYSVPLGPWWRLRARTSAGLLHGTGSDTITGTATAGSESARVGIEGADEAPSFSALVVMPELTAEVVLGSWSISGGLAGLFVPHAGPSFPRDELAVDSAGCPGNPASLGCAPVSRAIAAERTHGPFMVFVPEIGARVAF
jgi:hypothetical protein